LKNLFTGKVISGKVSDKKFIPVKTYPQVDMQKQRTTKHPSPSSAPENSGKSKDYWMYGTHAVHAALSNPKRMIKRLASTFPQQLPGAFGELAKKRRLTIEQIDAYYLQKCAPNAVTQDIIALVSPLAEADIDMVMETNAPEQPITLVILDQVTDPQNVGAILRSCAAFGAAAVILTDHHSAPESGALAKAASGALDVTPMIKAANLSRFMEQLKKDGFWCVGLSHDSVDAIGAVELPQKIALVLGAEGSGLRRLTREHCDLMVHLPTLPPIDQLNVSNAAAISLYEIRRQHLLLAAP